jgi:GDP-4-dehydro-6-deoxy-D-mannose reductase
VRVLVTGADGFVGRRLVRALLARHHEVVAACRPGGPPVAEWLGPDTDRVRCVPLELADPAPVPLGPEAVDAVAHLAAVSSGAAARDDPAYAWEVNAVGTVRLLATLADRRRERGEDPLVLLVSSGEVYGMGEPRPRRETDPVAPIAPYATSKAATELAGLEYWRRTGLRVVIARPFPHTGGGQSPAFVVPSFVARLREARRTGARTVTTGNLDPVRDLLDVRDVVAAYLGLLERGEPGEIYNVARGEGLAIRELFERLARLLELDVVPEVDPALLRSGDIPHLVGDRSKLERATGWRPTITLDETLRGVVDAEAD